MSQQKKKRNIPSKTGINLAMHEDHSASIRLLVLGGIVIALLAGAVAKFGVIDQFARVYAAQAAYQEIHSQLTAVEEALKDYDKVETDYRTHSMDWLGADTENGQSVDRQQVLDLVEQELMSCGKVNSAAVYHNQMHVTMSGMNLGQVSQMLQSLERSPIVAEAKLNNFDNEKRSFTLTILLQIEEVAE